MKTQTSNAVIPVLLSTIATKTFTFREITEAAELENAFRLRYDVYSKGRYCPFLKQNDHLVDIDIYDLHSKHYGLFVGSNKMVGYLRVVLDRNEYYNSEVFEIGKEFGIFNHSEHSIENIKNLSIPEYPFLSYSGVPESVTKYYHSLKNKREQVAEASRLIIKEEYRGLRTSGFLIECAMVLFILICLGQKHAIISCGKDHAFFYERCGFRPFGDSQNYNPLGISSDTVCLSLSSIPQSLLSKFEKIIAEFKITGKIQRTIN
jgi:predicted GNAT family N-acyltransferase